MLGELTLTSRGFEAIDFDDRNGVPCSLQQSSLALGGPPGSSALWLGERSLRMHLGRDQVEALTRHLLAWLATGSLEVPLSTDQPPPPPQQSSPEDLRRAAEQLTLSFPVGTPCRYWPLDRSGEGKSGSIRSAWFVVGPGQSNAGEVCVFVSGHPGYMLASHVEVLPVADQSGE